MLKLSTDSTRTALVTGATGGLGREFSRQLAERGFSLVLTARNEGALVDLARELREAHGVHVDVIALDLAEPEACDQLVAFVDGLGIFVDVLVNNAGFAEAAEFVDVPWERHERLLSVDIAALTHLTCAFGTRMKERGCGGILNVASLAAFYPGVYMATYYASKAYVHELSDAVAAELAPHGVTLTQVCPAPVRTDFFGRAGFGRKNVMRLAAYPAPFVARQALRGLWQGRRRVVPGLLNKLAVFAARLLPRWAKRAITGAIQYRPAHR